MQEQSRGKRKIKQGTVISNKMDKTVVVSVERTFRHPQYHKVITRRNKFYAHSEGQHNIGDVVTIVETRPLSKLKRWRVANAVKA